MATVFPRQGHDVLDPVDERLCPAADITVEQIGDSLGVDDAAWLDRSVSLASMAGRTQSESLSSTADAHAHGGAGRCIDAIREAFAELNARLAV